MVASLADLRSAFQLRIALVATITLAVALAAYSAFPHVGYLSELTVSGGVLADANKLADLYFVPLAVAVQLGGLAVIWFGADWSEPVERKRLLHKTSRLTVAVAATAFAISLIAFGRGHTLILLASLGLGFLVTKSGAPENRIGTFSLALLLTASLAWFVNHFLGYPALWIYSPAIIVFSYLTSRLSRYDAGIRILYAAAVFTLAFQFAVMAPYFWLPKEVGSSPNGLDLIIWSVAALAVAWGAIGVGRPSGGKFTGPPPFVLALGLFVATASGFNPFVLPTDDYHFGETLLGVDALFEGWGYFQSFISPHGLSDAFDGLGAWMAGDMSASGIQIGKHYWDLAVKLVLYWQLYRIAGPWVGTLVCLALPASFSILGPILLAILILQTGRITNDIVAGAVVVLLCAAAIFGFSGVGAAVAVPAYLSVIFLFRKRTIRGFAIFLASGAAAALMVLLPFSEQTFGQIAFLLASTASNLDIYGNGTLIGGVRVPYLAAPITFVLLPLMAFWMAYPGARDATKMRAGMNVALGILPIALFVLLFNSYAVSRLDVYAPRVFIAVMTILTAMTAWIAAPGFRRGESALTADTVRWRQAACAILMLFAAGPYSTVADFMARGSLMPPPGRATVAPIDPAIPLLGYGAFDEIHVNRIQAVKEATDVLLRPRETFFDLSNRNALYFYLGQRPPTAVSSVYNAAAGELQQRVLSDLAASRPELVFAGLDNMEFDGLALPLRSFGIYRYVIENYEPFEYGQHILALRTDLFQRAEDVSRPGRISLNPVSDKNWQNGIAVGPNASNWSFAVRPTMADRVRRGDSLIFSDGVTREVIRARGMNVRVTPDLAGLDGSSLSFTIEGNTESRTRAQLWSAAFSVRNLRRIPSAWGRAERRLQDEFEPGAIPLKRIGGLNVTEIPASSGEYGVAGDDPQWIFRPHSKISPQENGILRLETACGGSKAIPRIQIFWRADDEPFSEARSVVFSASHTVNLIPLDSSPEWYLATSVDELRIDIDGCETVQIEPVRLISRKRTE